MLGIKGFGSELSLLLLVILIFDKIIIPLYINWKKDKRFTLRTQKLQVSPVVNNPGTVKPGDGTACKENRDKLVKLEEKVGNVEKNIKEIKRNNRDDHKSMFEKIDKIKNNRRL